MSIDRVCPVLGQSRTKAEAMEFVQAHSNYILSKQGNIPIATKVIDWQLPRGQGKRTASTVKGGMCTLTGPTTYNCVDLSTFSELMEDPNRNLVLHDANRAARYAGAFNGGCNHIESMCFAIKPNFSIKSTN
ncbi:hypothetical protein L1D14_07520 [Vibrio tubiashii]|uniref:hypothetical protein n=1 Tax=Vibrio tubiashii TaxID=29498 RepID=UPI001EFCA1EE|nr:hypothetical protein [Vibrio tubiashii]MCG9576087.1 hypothetical protein [Vibrio tubiashii]